MRGAALARIIAAAALLLGAPAAAAETVDVRAGRLIDPDSARVLTDQRIRIVDGKIAAVSEWRDADGPAGIDWSSKTVLPGLIDLHTHVADGSTQSSDPLSMLKLGEAATILEAAEAARIMLASGFTTVRDVGVYRGLTDVALRDAIDAGTIEGPRMRSRAAISPRRAGAATSTGWRPTYRFRRNFGSESSAMPTKRATARAFCSTVERTSSS
jgi:cytosine/adenosine deaminase-related metal-dependent hydrolase